MVTGAIVLLFLCGWATAAPRPPAIPERASLATFNGDICPGDKVFARIVIPSTGTVGLRVHLPNEQETVKIQLNLDKMVVNIQSTSGINLNLPADSIDAEISDITPLEMTHLQLEYLEQGVRLSANGQEIRSFSFSTTPLPCLSGNLELYSIGTDVDLGAGASVRFLQA